MADQPRPFGPYELLKPLGAGGMGDVFLARPLDPSSPLPWPLVIKRLHSGVAGDAVTRERFAHEAEVIRAVSSPHLPRLYDFGRVDELGYIAMEYVTGWTVDRLIRDLVKAGKLPPPTAAIEVMAGALLGLEAIHTATDARGEPLHIVHRDVTPKNVMLGEDGVTRLIDLGLGKSRLQEWRTSTGVVLGTPGYMAPEQVHARPVDARTDVYAAGIVCFELLTLASYFQRSSVAMMLRAQAKPTFVKPTSLRPDLPAALDEVLSVALAPDPDRRFPSAAAFREALLRAVPVQPRVALPSLVGDLLRGELEEEKTAVTELMTRIAAPAGWVPPDPASAVPRSSPQSSFSQAAPARLRPSTLAAIVLGTTAVGAATGLLILGSGPTTKTVVAVLPPPGVVQATAAPTAAPLAREESASTSSAAAKVEGGDRPATTSVRPATSRTTPSEADAEKTTAARTPAAGHEGSRKAADEAPTGRERLTELLRQARALRARLPAGSEGATQATSLVGRLLAEASTPEDEGSAARVAQLEAELGRLQPQR